MKQTALVWPLSKREARTGGFCISEGRMKKFVLASLFVVAAAAMQPALAAKGGEAKLCGKGQTVCACGKLPGAMFQCCEKKPKAKCDCSGGVPNCKYH
jgi:hypothetical protein